VPPWHAAVHSTVQTYWHINSLTALHKSSRLNPNILSQKVAHWLYTPALSRGNVNLYLLVFTPILLFSCYRQTDKQTYRQTAETYNAAYWSGRIGLHVSDVAYSTILTNSRLNKSDTDILYVTQNIAVVCHYAIDVNIFSCFLVLQAPYTMWNHNTQVC